MKIEYPIFFFYYKDLEQAFNFYQEVLNFKLEIDQGWCKILKIRESAYLGLVDERRGSLKAVKEKGALLTLVVDKVEAWHEHLARKKVQGLTPIFKNEEIGVQGFFFEDPEGYKIEIQKFLK
ncbi:MAG: VOC family protein [Caldiserica bacterium]|nr:VOC family protein [Caldisericota bacterium]MDH7562369.1 VOC family protein [Caldisericota bacterium]